MAFIFLEFGTFAFALIFFAFVALEVLDFLKLQEQNTSELVIIDKYSEIACSIFTFQ